MTTINNMPESIEAYNGFELRTKANGPESNFYTTLIYKDGKPVGGSFAGPSEGSDSVKKAKSKIDSK